MQNFSYSLLRLDFSEINLVNLDKIIFKTSLNKLNRKAIFEKSFVKIPILGCPESSCNSYTVKPWINNYRIY